MKRIILLLTIVFTFFPSEAQKRNTVIIDQAPTIESPTGK